MSVCSCVVLCCVEVLCFILKLFMFRYEYMMMYLRRRFNVSNVTHRSDQSGLYRYSVVFCVVTEDCGYVLSSECVCCGWESCVTSEVIFFCSLPEELRISPGQIKRCHFAWFHVSERIA